MFSNLAIGIDLGTTNTCAAVFRDGCIEIIPNENGNNTTPSFVLFSDEKGRLIGEDAKTQAAYQVENGVFSFKRLIGRKFDDIDVQKDIENFPFHVFKDGGQIKIQVVFRRKKRSYYPEELSSIILLKIKEIAEAYLKTEVKNCVITVPANFNDSQRQATIDAGKLAGFNVLKIINEPTAAVLAYVGLNKKQFLKKKNILIYDLGGGTFDVTIANVYKNDVKILSTTGDTHLGGDDMDSKLIKYVIEEYETEHDITLDDKIEIRRLRLACEKAKTILSSANETQLEIDAVHKLTRINTKLSREKFNDLCNDLFQSTVTIIEKCLTRANLTKKDIDEIVMVGGSSRIPKIRSIVQEFFNGKELNKSINPDEAVAHGAAISAFLYGKENVKESDNINLEDVTSMSLGIGVKDGLMDIIIPMNTNIPTKVTKKYRTIKDNQTKINLTVLEGESEYSKENNTLGEFTIDGLPEKRKGEVEVLVTFDLNDSGILTIDCEETSTSVRNQLIITHDKGRLSDDDIQRIKAENIIEDEGQKLRNKISDEKNRIYEYCFDTKNTITDEVSDSALEIITEKCNEIVEWVDINPDVQLHEYQAKYEELKSFIDDRQYENVDTCEPVTNEKEQNSVDSMEDIKNTIYDYCEDKENEIPNHILDSVKSKIIKKCCDTQDWLDNNENENMQKYLSIFEDLKDYCQKQMANNTDDQESSDPISDIQNKILDFCEETKTNIKGKKPPSIYRKINKKCDEIIKWVDDNDNCELREYDLKYNEILEFCNEYVFKLS